MSVRTDFIKTSTFEVLQQGVAAVDCMLSYGIDSYPSLEYVLQSLLLKMTGFGEQKLRNICWEIATVDLGYRYKTLQGQVAYGEFSNIENKKDIYLLLYNKSKEVDSKNEIRLDDKKKMLNAVLTEISTVFENSIFVVSYPTAYKCAMEFIKKWKPEQFAKNKTFVMDPLDKCYEMLYKQRNRCAHNTLSYQQDVLLLKEIQDKDFGYWNFFSYFALLLLFDKIFMKAFVIYQESISSNC